MTLNVNELPKDLANQIKKENGVPTRKHNLTKDEVRGLAIAMLNQAKGFSKSDIGRVLSLARKMLEV